MTPLASSELILNPDGSIYHLHLRPEHIADTIITVGDPDRVKQVSQHFDQIEHQVQRREFCTHIGRIGRQRLTVISTGIGTDNIDIVLNELDALVNIDLETRLVRKKTKSLNIIRIGTSGAIQPDIDVDRWLVSKRAVGFDSLLHWYQHEPTHDGFTTALKDQLELGQYSSAPYLSEAGPDLLQAFASPALIEGNTVTNVGFYGPQSRKLRLDLAQPNLPSRLQNFSYQGERLTNLEMETAGIYALAHLLGHQAISLNAILANRATGVFSTHSQKAVDQLIIHTLGVITSL